MKSERRSIFPKYVQPQLEPSLEKRTMKFQTKWRIIYIYIKSWRKNKWEKKLRERTLREPSGRIDEKGVKSILECGCYVRNWSCLKKGLLTFIYKFYLLTKFWNGCNLFVCFVYQLPQMILVSSFPLIICNIKIYIFLFLSLFLFFVFVFFFCHIWVIHFGSFPKMFFSYTDILSLLLHIFSGFVV